MNVQVVVQSLRSYIERNGYSQVRLSRETGIPQSTISRALAKPARVTKTHRALCKLAGISLEANRVETAAEQELVRSVLDVWDGSREHAQTIARLLKAAASLEAYRASRASKSR